MDNNQKKNIVEILKNNGFIPVDGDVYKIIYEIEFVGDSWDFILKKILVDSNLYKN